MGVDPLAFPWSAEGEAVLSAFGVQEAVGLTEEQVSAQRAKHGYNELEKEPPTPLWKLVLEQFDDMLVKVRSCSACKVFVFKGLAHACDGRLPVEVAACHHKEVLMGYTHTWAVAVRLCTIQHSGSAWQ